ncbi:MAG TPA: hypothetical protein DHV48_04915 [Prolixibacteraceae bacterium]|nr:hypothetical protein [Prolixibacteraceae bacterium]
MSAWVHKFPHRKTQLGIIISLCTFELRTHVLIFWLYATKTIRQSSLVLEEKLKCAELLFSKI